MNITTDAPSTQPKSEPEFAWKRWPETDALLDRFVESFLARHSFAADLSARMRDETGTRFKDWIDYVVLANGPGLGRELVALGYARSGLSFGVSGIVLTHPGGQFPTVILDRSRAASAGSYEVGEIGLKVESVADFSRAHDLGLEILGMPLGPFRVAHVPSDGVRLAAVERRGYRGFEPMDGEMARLGRMRPHAARDALAARDLWLARRRRFDSDDEGIAETERLLGKVIEVAGSVDLACHLVFEVEREYWQSRNHAARFQKARQDRLGLGWANHDHHTFRCSRRFFPRIIGMFESLGFTLRERFHAGAHAGWGAQVLEHPTTGIVIFADLDLAAEESTHDFAHHPLPDLPRPSTVGLWVALHGESILEAGMHHLEAQFDFDALREGLKSEGNIDVMPPFSNFPFLRQAFTTGERWAVSKHRADRALQSGLIDEAQHARFLKEGTIGSHLENLERRDGYKGFNQQAVSAILAATDPRLH